MTIKDKKNVHPLWSTLDNSYQIQKTIKFNLENFSWIKKDIWNITFNNKIFNFIDKYEWVHPFISLIQDQVNNIKNIIDMIDDKESYKINTYIAKDYIKQIDKDFVYLSNNTRSWRYDLNKLGNTWNIIKHHNLEHIHILNNLLNQISDDINSPDHNKKDIVGIQQNIKNVIHIYKQLIAFVKNTTYDGNNMIIQTTINHQSSDMEDFLEYILSHVLTKNPQWVQVGKVAMNYYIVNKDYFVDQQQEKQRIVFLEKQVKEYGNVLEKFRKAKAEFGEVLNDCVNYKLFEAWVMKQKGWNNYAQKCADKFGRVINYNSNSTKKINLPHIKNSKKTVIYELDDIYNILKQFIESESPEFDKYVEICKQQKELNIKKQQWSDNNIDNQLMHLWQKKWSIKKWFKPYQNFRLNKENISMAYGQAKAELKKKKNYFLQTDAYNYFGCLLQDPSDNYYLAYVEKTEAKKLFDSIKNQPIYTPWEHVQDNSFILYQIDSITPKAIEKLWLYNNAFDDVEDSWARRIFEKAEYQWENNKDNLTKLISFLQKCLIDSSFAKNYCEVYDFSFKKPYEYTSLQQFYQDVTKQGYVITPKIVKTYDLEHIWYKLSPITSTDLKKSLDTIKPWSTVDIFRKSLDRWNSHLHYPIRLNPEATIFHRTQAVQDKKLKDVEYQNKENNIIEKRRYTKDSTKIWFGVTLNAFSEHIAGNKQDELEKHQKKFNKWIRDRVQKNHEQIYYYGIDRGINELATMCLMDHKHNLLKIDVYQPEESNPSILQSTPTTKQFLDLTYLKAEWDKIVYRKNNNYEKKLKLIGDKRKIQARLFQHTEYFINIISNNKGSIDLDILNKDHILYDRLFDQQNEWDIENMISDRYQQIKKVQEKYGDKRKQHLYEVNKLEDVEYLRQWFVANAIGVITLLLKQYPWIICLEHVAKEKKNETIDIITWQKIWVWSDYEAQLSKRAGIPIYQVFETQLFKKLQKFSWLDDNISIQLTPTFSNISQLKYKEELQSKRLWQLWIIFTIPADNTSNRCPACGYASTNHPWNNLGNACIDDNHILIPDIKNHDFGIWETENYELRIPLSKQIMFGYYSWSLDSEILEDRIKECMWKDNINDAISTFNINDSNIKSQKKKLFDKKWDSPDQKRNQYFQNRYKVDGDILWCVSCWYKSNQDHKNLPACSWDDLAAYTISYITQKLINTYISPYKWHEKTYQSKKSMKNTSIDNKPFASISL